MKTKQSECSPAFDKLAADAEGHVEYTAFRKMLLANFGQLAERAGKYISRMCNRDRGVVLEHALLLAWELRENYNPVTIDLLHFWDECLQGAIRMQSYWFVRNFDGWRRMDSELFCGLFGLPVSSEDEESET